MNDVRRIAFVSERFLELQGLGPAIFGGTLIFATLMQHLVDGPTRSMNVVPLFMFAATTAGGTTPLTCHPCARSPSSSCPRRRRSA